MKELNENKVPLDLENFLNLNLPNVGKKKKNFVLAV